MTNESKAQEIAVGSGYLSNFRHDSESEYHGAFEMAKWKDQQVKEAINEVLDYFDRGREAGFVSQNSYNDMKYFASKVIEKLFDK